MFVAAIIWLELFLYIAAGFTFFQKRAYSISESIVFSILLLFVSASVAIQVSFLIGFTPLVFAVESIAFATASSYLYLNGKVLLNAWRYIAAFVRSHALTCGFLFAVWMLLAMYAFFLPPDTWDSMTYHLSRVLMFQQADTFFTKNVQSFMQANFPLGSDVLTHLFLRFYTDYGVAVYSWLAYVACGVAVYACSRRFADADRALCAVCIVLSMPMLVFQSISTKNDIVTAAVAVGSLVALARLYENFHFRDYFIWLVLLSYGLSVKLTFLAFAVPMLVVGHGLIVFRHRFVHVWKTMFSSKAGMAALCVAMFFSAHLWFFVYNYFEWGGAFGMPVANAMYKNHDGIVGGAANLVRHGLGSIHFLHPTDMLLKDLTGVSCVDSLQSFYDRFLEPVWHGAGLRKTPPTPFRIQWYPQEHDSWFGPLSVLVLLPCMAIALIRGNGFLRLVALSLFAYAGIISYSIAWMPWNNRFFSLFFICAGVLVPFTLQHLYFQRWIRWKLMLVSACILLYAIASNMHKPLIPLQNSEYVLRASMKLELRPQNLIDIWQSIEANNVWSQTRFGFDRDYYANQHFGDERVAFFTSEVAPNARVAVRANNNSWVYHFILARPDVVFVFQPRNVLSDDGRIEYSRIKNYDYFLCVDRFCVEVIGAPHARLLWNADDGPGKRKGTLHDLRE